MDYTVIHKDEEVIYCGHIHNTDLEALKAAIEECNKIFGFNETLAIIEGIWPVEYYA